MSTAARTSSVIVVGVDGSAASKAALRWAIAEATRRDCVVRAVAVSPTPELMPATSLAMEPRGMRFPVHDPAENARRLATLPDHTIVMHPGPMNRGLEISADAADSPRAVIVEQVSNGVAVRMAVLYLLLAGETTNTKAVSE